MDLEQYIQLGINGDAPLKVIMQGKVEKVENKKVGVVSLVYATMETKLAETKLRKLAEQDSQAYYMVYSVPLDMDLTALEHYPSIAIMKEDVL
ncbi:hypothetical protein [Candidatus Enterococcus ferrettii]|uniref:Uncharacterized protein n=1 Tax=Candidatus Enterococcus ferrettii TaxID=2815324 RepID=A0ABV0EUD1_9ENTE|nr:hypothetical protein [Enterococcus sp. 665A]MBO1339450.1 hypothetical protein [Enterococcus sp. 665A]